MAGFLILKGLDSHKITTLGLGETNLVCEEKNPKKSSECAAQNRRVEITTQFTK